MERLQRRLYYDLYLSDYLSLESQITGTCNLRQFVLVLIAIKIHHGQHISGDLEDMPMSVAGQQCQLQGKRHSGNSSPITHAAHIIAKLCELGRCYGTGPWIRHHLVFLFSFLRKRWLGRQHPKLPSLAKSGETDSAIW